ncbi:bifunctional ADP-dependent NAD(P)H-hydrate dehydratase/NAD(P)H-hydrate epimerase [Marichromatium gracile]|uniref:Bifunctional NAD(P)H-hydrate repair enzyme n=1 Tax=Marichromatium gracile TaxID=1048 RepID=A0ABR5VGK2_MARGR|nr:bifunctional ADP-dependent NAD(P)H-hydrate dehydratase/NAD(P)H-hydrate epimerase [Marichromatium gracile]KXX64851.1 bifunctional ADP-dependent (S)-NAD(P)H-hydrate dehydratase/NAD(P)H-hydrate epimerase [Marichromatium gracile]
MNQPSLPHALHRADQARALDRAACLQPDLSGRELMERAARAAQRLVAARWPQARRVCVLVGGGNNGGDGYALARLLRRAGREVRVLSLVAPERLRHEAAEACRDWRAAGGSVEPWRGGLPEDAELLVDALLGIGLERPLREHWAEAVRALNAHPAPVLALDLPTGLHADRGAVLGEVVRASATISFIVLKQGLLTGAGPGCCGRLHWDSLGVPEALLVAAPASARRIDWAGQRACLGVRRRDAHKGQCGHVLVIGGAPGMSGAARLAGEAALRAGAGLVTIATHPAHAALLNLTRPELMVHGVEHGGDLGPLLARADLVAIGPGLGREAWGRGLWQRVLECRLPLVVDADALNLLAEQSLRRDDWVLTPHPGEAGRLLGCGTAAVEADRFAALATLRQKYGGVLVLKGAGTLVADADATPPAVCSDGNPGMATAGAGDVLTGVVAALIGQGMDAGGAARVGVCLHAAAGDRAALAGERGMIAGDIIEAVRALADGRENHHA